MVMTAIPIRELSHHTARCMAVVKAGETVDITERGKIIGRIVPVDPVHDVRARMIAEGRMRPATAGRAALLAAVRRRLAAEPVDAASRGTAALLEMRDDERY
ncbi:Antitoxin component of toxin-antitoxin stability system, DNA-binding transcriptional repressor [Thermomonospora echinospora]|uniref:Antitoxin component of toxin-antitoxin stability system, DNA-binding transcriptional repressor n=2 Tax=Thermomonospora echinospora TaxID=1992 RepID=A0A1H6DL67_9ACTN|nr:Antitoxin component of toxin-antitoxin stability system, DNA-binding transcriptional repressor [Thermomonospora echinospora]